MYRQSSEYYCTPQHRTQRDPLEDLEMLLLLADPGARSENEFAIVKTMLIPAISDW
jgi:hypothetical protein